MPARGLSSYSVALLWQQGSGQRRKIGSAPHMSNRGGAKFPPANSAHMAGIALQLVLLLPLAVAAPAHVDPASAGAVFDGIGGASGGGGGGGESSPLLSDGELSDACPREGDGGAASARSARSLSRTLS